MQASGVGTCTGSAPRIPMGRDKFISMMALSIRCAAQPWPRLGAGIAQLTASRQSGSPRTAMAARLRPAAPAARPLLGRRLPRVRDKGRGGPAPPLLPGPRGSVGCRWVFTQSGTFAHTQTRLWGSNKSNQYVYPDLNEFVHTSVLV